MAAASSNASTSNDSPERVGEQEGLQGDWAALLAEVDRCAACLLRDLNCTHPRSYTCLDKPLAAPSQSSLLLRDDDPRSKYEARRRLLQRPPPPASDAPFTAARRAFRLGRIAVDAEEPAAEAEKLLKEACGIFFPGLHDAVVVAAAADGSAAGLAHPPVVVVGASLVAVREACIFENGTLHQQCLSGALHCIQQVLASSSSSSTPGEAVAVAEEALETINLLVRSSHQSSCHAWHSFTLIHAHTCRASSSPGGRSCSAPGPSSSRPSRRTGSWHPTCHRQQLHRSDATAGNGNTGGRCRGPTPTRSFTSGKSTRHCATSRPRPRTSTKRWRSR